MTKKGGGKGGKGAKGGSKRDKPETSPELLNQQTGKQAKMSEQQTPSYQQPYHQQSPTYGQLYPPHLQFTPVQQTPPQPVPNGSNFAIQSILDRLDSIDRKLCKLDSIESQMTHMSQKLTVIDNRVSNLHEQKQKISDLETSRNFDSEICNEMKTKHLELEKKMNDEKSRNEKVINDLKTLQIENKRISEEMIDLQSRSMRDNLMFFNFDEMPNANDRAKEDCSSKIADFLESTLQLENASDIKIDRAHRVGSFSVGKIRPIIAKFNFHQDKLRVKQAAVEKLKGSNFRVSDQYPKQIQERRKKLVPIMVKAKQEGKHAYISYDKLFINGTRYTADNFPDD